MLTTLDRYLLKEVIQTWAAVTVVLLLIMLSSRFARYLGEAAAGQLPADVVFTLLSLTSIHYLTVLVPVSLFLAVMLMLGRLYKDSEMAAMMACGIGYARLLRPLLLLAGFAAVGLALLSMEVSPWAARATHQVRERAAQESEAAGFQPGRFRSVGDAVFYAQEVEGAGDLSRVFIHYRDNEAMTVSLAERAEQRTDPATGVRHLVLHEGRHYSGVPGTNEYRSIEFDEHGLRIELRESDGLVPRRTVQQTSALLRSDDPGDIAELQWRVSVPLMGFLLVLLAVPLGRTTPRQGRYGKLFAAILVYVVYSNLVGLSQVWIERGQISPWLGVWWVHAAVLLLTGGLVVKHYGWRYVFSRRSAEAPA